jgi:hypothetical protein
VKNTREVLAFAGLGLFATNDAHVIVAARSLMRLTPDLKDDGAFDYASNGHKSGNVENISPDGSTLGNATSPGFELIDTHTCKSHRDYGGRVRRYIGERPGIRDGQRALDS